MVLPVRMRIHCGIGRFCFSFLASVFFVFIDLLAGCGAGRSRAGKQHEREAGGQHIVRSREEWLLAVPCRRDFLTAAAVESSSIQQINYSFFVPFKMAFDYKQNTRRQ